MKLVSTRNENNKISFENAVINCMPLDGGLYVPDENETPDLRRWLLYTNEKTTFSSIAGALMTAVLKDELSAVLCETIAEKSFTFKPEFKKLDEKLYLLDLSKGPTGSHKDFGISFLVNYLETILTIKDENVYFLDVTYGELGASLVQALRGKKKVKAILIFPKGLARGLKESDLLENGGNILPLEFDGTEEEAHILAREIFNDKDFIEKNKITIANTANFGRLLPQMFFYPFAFSRLKKMTNSNIYYATETGNYSNIVSALYAWKVALPMGGIITASSSELALNPEGNCEIIDSIVPKEKREKCDPVSPSNIERLEDFFHNYSEMLENLVFLADVSDEETKEACQKLYKNYGIFADEETSKSYAASLKRKDLTDEDVTVLVLRDHPSLSKEYVEFVLGEKINIPESIRECFEKTKLNYKVKSSEEVKNLIKKFIGA